MRRSFTLRNRGANGDTWKLLGARVCILAWLASTSGCIQPEDTQPINQSCWDLVEKVADGCKTEDQAASATGNDIFYCQDIAIESFATCSDLCGEGGAACIDGEMPPSVVGHHRFLPGSGEPWPIDFLDQSEHSISLDIARVRVAYDGDKSFSLHPARIFGHDDRFTIYDGNRWATHAVASSGLYFMVLGGTKDSCKQDLWQGAEINISEIDSETHGLRGTINRFQVLCDTQ